MKDYCFTIFLAALDTWILLNSPSLQIIWAGGQLRTSHVSRFSAASGPTTKASHSTRLRGTKEGVI